MSITEELREYASSLAMKAGASTTEVKGALEEIADRIDIAHKHTIGYVDDRDPDTMAEHGWVRLPKDADGETIHIGELVDEMLPFGGYAAPAPVDTMELSRGASGYGWMVKLDAENRSFISPKLLRHYHEPTVEDVLEELLREYDRDDSELTDGEIIERFAAKLRLAGDE